MKKQNMNLGKNLSSEHYIEEYKSLRNEICEKYQYESTYAIYSVLSTATILGFAIQYPSAFLFLLPMIILIPLSYKILGQHRGILGIGTYISTVIEPKVNGLQWETFQKKRRLRKITNENPFRQLSTHMLFNFLGFLSIISSITYALFYDKKIWNILQNFSVNWNETFQQVVLIVLWVISILYLIVWTSKIRNVFCKENQEKMVKEIELLLNTKVKTD